jgi:hypothetical protein
MVMRFLRRRGWMVGMVWVALATARPVEADQPPAKGDPRAAALLEEAAKTRYTWSPEVTAVSGKITWDQDGQAGAATFRSVLHKRSGLKLTSENGAKVPAEVRDHLASLIGHRTPPRSSAAEGSNANSAMTSSLKPHGHGRQANEPSRDAGSGLAWLYLYRC